MNLATAELYADKLAIWLADYCSHIEIVGSVRRERPVCNDIDLVVIPRTVEETDLLGGKAATRNLLHEFLTKHVLDSMTKEKARQAKWIQGETLREDTRQLIVQLPKCQLDIFFATKETLATRMLSRTGSKEHNIWLCQRAQSYGFHWNPLEGLVRARGLGTATVEPTKTEAEIYQLLGLNWIDPKDREMTHLCKL